MQAHTHPLLAFVLETSSSSLLSFHGCFCWVCSCLRSARYGIVPTRQPQHPMHVMCVQGSLRGTAEASDSGPNNSLTRTITCVYLPCVSFHTCAPCLACPPPSQCFGDEGMRSGGLRAAALCARSVCACAVRT